MNPEWDIATGYTSALGWNLGALACYTLSFVTLAFLGKRLGKVGGVLATGLSGLAMVFGLMGWIGFEQNAWLRFEWLEVGAFQLYLGFAQDNITALLLAMVSGITFLVHLFSTRYMAKDDHQGRYWAFLGLFAMAMSGVVLAGDYLSMFIFWELVGLASYFLIGFWFNREDAARASQKAFVVNRMGDVGFVVALLCLFGTGRGFMIEGDTWEESSWMAIVGSIGFALAAFGKSAQFPLQIWLPDAMAGPTPVSSLIHAATMVAAGVYLLLRTQPLLATPILIALALIGSLTALLAALSALSQTDIKRVLAYSTVSQLGFMVMGIGVGAEAYSFFHLLTHAFFKCGLFLAAGAVIHTLHEAAHHAKVEFDAQDIRWMGGLRKKLPLVFGCYVVFGAALAGLPLFSGFLSKEGLVLGAWTWAATHGTWTWAVPVMAILSSGLTAFYIARHGMLIFGGKNRIALQPDKAGIYTHLKSVSWAMWLPLLVLAAFSLWTIWSPTQPFHATWLPEGLVNHTGHGPAWLPWALTGLAITGIGLAFWVYRNGPAVANPNTWWYQLSFQHFFFDRLGHAWVAIPALVWGRWLSWWDRFVVDGWVNFVAGAVVRDGGKASLASAASWTDRNLIDRFVNGTAHWAMRLGGGLRQLQTGKIQLYLLYSLLALLLLLLGLYYFTTVA